MSLDVFGLDVVGAVLEAHQVALGRLGGGGRRGTPEAELRPAASPRCRGQSGEVADDVERDLSGRSQQACTHRSPPLRAGFESSSPGRRRQVGERGRPILANPNRSSKKAGPKPTVIVSWAGAKPSASPGVDRRGLRGDVDCTDRQPPGSSAPPPPPTGRASPYGLDVRGRDVERGEGQPVLGGGGDSGLMHAVERHRARASCWCCRRRWPRRCHTRCRRHRPRRPARARHQGNAAGSSRPATRRSAGVTVAGGPGRASRAHAFATLLATSRQRLLHGLDRGRELLLVGVGQRGVEHEAGRVGAGAVGVDERVRGR